MKLFKDVNGKEYSVAVNVLAVKKLRAIGCDIMAADGSGIQQLANDPVLLLDALYTLCGSQVTVTQDEWLEAFSGDTIETATNAMVEAIIDFFPQSRRAVLQKGMAKSRELEKQILALAEQKIDLMDCESAMNSQASQELTQQD